MSSLWLDQPNVQLGHWNAADEQAKLPDACLFCAHGAQTPCLDYAAHEEESLIHETLEIKPRICLQAAFRQCTETQQSRPPDGLVLHRQESFMLCSDTSTSEVLLAILTDFIPISRIPMCAGTAKGCVCGESRYLASLVLLP